MRKVFVLVSVVVLALGVVGCRGGGDDPVTVRGTPTPDADETPDADDDTDDADDDRDEDIASPRPGATAPDGPGPDGPDGAPAPECEPVEGDGDVFRIPDAGEVELRMEGGGLVIVEVRPAPGWQFEVEETDFDDEVEVTFRSGERELEFEAHVEGGGVSAQVCR